jgi:HK97 family phage portal protein
MKIFNKIRDVFSDALFEEDGIEYKNNDFCRESHFNFGSSNNLDGDLNETRTYYAFSDKGYSRNPIAFRAINLITHTASSIPLFVMHCRDCKNYNITDHNLSRLVERPNPFTSKVDFIELIIYHLLINGNAFVLKVHDLNGDVNELHVLHPSSVEVLTDRSCSFVAGYVYRNGSKVKEYMVNRVDGSCDILHLKNFHPNNQVLGLSPFEAAADAIDQHNATMKWNKSLMKNSARPSGALFVKDSKNSGGYLNAEQRNRLESELENFHRGETNSGRPLLLEGGLEWRELSVSPKDLDFVNSDKIAVRHIANAFGVPVQLLNDSESSSYNNYIEAKRSLYENTVLPILNKIVTNVYNNWICKSFGKDFFVTYREEEIPALTYKKEQMLNNLKNSDFLTINEKRAAFGLDPIEGGDKLNIVK